jgi:hypothetical protein
MLTDQLDRQENTLREIDTFPQQNCCHSGSICTATTLALAMAATVAFFATFLVNHGIAAAFWAEIPRQGK